MMANRKRNIKGQWFGELRAVREVGTMGYDWQGVRVRITAWLFRCKRRHVETRNLASIRVSGDKAKCKQCAIQRRLKHE